MGKKSTYKKGRELEKWVADIFKTHGNWVQSFIPPAVKYQPRDIFGMFDISALFQTKQGNVSQIYVQVKSNLSDYYSFKKTLTEWTKKYVKETTDVVFCLVWSNKKIIRVWYPLVAHEQKYELVGKGYDAKLIQIPHNT